MEIRFPDNTKSILYIKDIKNLEVNLRYSGFLNLPEDYYTYLVEYFKEENPIIGAYGEFRKLENGNFIKSIIGETAIINAEGGSIVVINLDKSSKYFSTLMNIFKVKGQFNNFFVEFFGNNVLLSRNQSLIELYKKSPSKSDDPVWKNQDMDNSDIIYYSVDKNLIHPFLDFLFVKEGQSRKSFSVSINFQRKNINICTKPVLFTGKEVRSLVPSQIIPSPLIYFDTAQNPEEFFAKIFGELNVKNYRKDLRELFDNQVVVALLSISTNVEPSFIVVLKSKLGKAGKVEKFLLTFSSNVIGEKEWERERKGLYTINYAKNSSYFFMTRGEYVIIFDNKMSLSRYLDVMSKKTFSILDERYGQEIKNFSSKPFVLYINFSDLAERIYKSMLTTMDLDTSQKEDIKTYLKGIKDMGVLLGYGNSRNDCNYFQFTLKSRSKDKK